MTTSINTKKAPRRELAFHCNGCVNADLASIEAAHIAGTLAHTGNWSEGEILDHVAKMWEMAFDGFPPESTPNFAIKIIARLMKGRMTSGKTLPAGFQLPANARFMLPTTGTSFDEGMQRMRAVLGRLDRGEQMTATSPVFGKMSHDEWMRLHLGHAQLHFGFLALR